MPDSPDASVYGGHYEGHDSRFPAGGPYGTQPSPYADGPYGYQQLPPYGTPFRTPGSDIKVGDALKWAWSRAFSNPLILAWMPVLLVAIALVVSGLFSLVDDDALGAAIGVPLVLICVLMMMLGLQSAALRIACGQKVTVRSLIAPPNGFHAGAALVLASLTQLIASIIPFGGLVVGYFFWMTTIVAMEQKCSCFAAIGRSCRIMARGGNAPLVALALIVVHIAGLLTVIGWFVSVPLIYLVTAYVYMRLTGRDVSR